MTQGLTMTPILLRTSQRGATLLELMVGITIGLLTVTVALGALLPWLALGPALGLWALWPLVREERRGAPG